METWNDFLEELEEEKVLSENDLQYSKELARLTSELIKLRKAHGVTQNELGERSGLKQAAIARIEKMDSVPRLDTFLKLILALNITIKLQEKEENLIQIIDFKMTQVSPFSFSEKVVINS